MIKVKNYLCVWLSVFLVTAVSIAAQNVEKIPSQAEQIANTQKLFNAGNVLMGKNDFQQAVQKYTEAIASSPSIAVIYVNRGLAYLQLSNLQEALSDAEKALTLLETGQNPPVHSALAYQVKGMVFQNQKNYKVALECFSKAIEIDPRNGKLWNSRGGIYFNTKEYDKALKDFDKAIELDNSLAMFYSNRASIKLELKDVDAALLDLNEALKLDDANPLVYYTRGNAYSKLSKLDEALKDYDRAISLRPTSAYYYGRGRIYLVLGKYELSVKDNSEALLLDPSNIFALYNRAVSYNKMGKNQLAIDDLQRAVSINEGSATMRYMLGYLFFRNSQFAEAVAAASKAIEFAPNWKVAYLLRALAYAKAGNTAKAKADREVAAGLSANYKPAESALFIELTVYMPEDLNQ